MTPSLEDWMLLAMELHGNTVLHHKRVKRYGKDAWVKAFADAGYDVEIRKSDGLCGAEFDFDLRRNRNSKEEDYIVEEVKK